MGLSLPMVIVFCCWAWDLRSLQRVLWCGLTRSRWAFPTASKFPLLAGFLVGGKRIYKSFNMENHAFESWGSVTLLQLRLHYGDLLPSHFPCRLLASGSRNEFWMTCSGQILLVIRVLWGWHVHFAIPRRQDGFISTSNQRLSLMPEQTKWSEADRDLSLCSSAGREKRPAETEPDDLMSCNQFVLLWETADVWSNLKRGCIWALFKYSIKEGCEDLNLPLNPGLPLTEVVQ